MLRKNYETNIGIMAAVALDQSKRVYLKQRCGKLRRDNAFINKVRDLWGQGLDPERILKKLRRQHYRLCIELIEDIVDEECTPFYSAAEVHKCSGCGAKICTDICIACSVSGKV